MKQRGTYIIEPRDRWIATVFVVPAVPEKQWKVDSERKRVLGEFVRAVRKVKADVKAWTLPKGLARWRGCEGEEGTEFHRYFPAIAVLGRRVKKGKRRA